MISNNTNDALMVSMAVKHNVAISKKQKKNSLKLFAKKLSKLFCQKL